MKKILLVDDEPTILELLAETIAEDISDVEVEVATDGLQASRMLLSRKYDAIILDINLPNKSGVAIIEEFIKRDSSICSKTVVMSGAVTKKTIEYLLKLGTHAVYEKPFDIGKFVASIQQILDKAGNE
tara:strand:+ start:18269 stop:18652 length:384 start_codon:yes stop_codon:yes gene_type:complete